MDMENRIFYVCQRMSTKIWKLQTVSAASQRKKPKCRTPPECGPYDEICYGTIRVCSPAPPGKFDFKYGITYNEKSGSAPADSSAIEKGDIG